MDSIAHILPSAKRVLTSIFKSGNIFVVTQPCSQSTSLFFLKSIWKEGENREGIVNMCSRFIGRLASWLSEKMKPFAFYCIHATETLDEKIHKHLSYKKNSLSLNASLWQLWSSNRIDYFLYWRILQTLADSCRLLRNHAESCRILQNPAESCRVLQSLAESCRVLQIFAKSFRILKNCAQSEV